MSGREGAYWYVSEAHPTEVWEHNRPEGARARVAICSDPSLAAQIVEDHNLRLAKGEHAGQLSPEPQAVQVAIARQEAAATGGRTADDGY